jgi:hypothetical protein
MRRIEQPQAKAHGPTISVPVSQSENWVGSATINSLKAAALVAL